MTMATGGQSFEFCSMRNRHGQRPGKPIPFGERPPDRPFANELGTGRNFAAREGRVRDSHSGALSKESNTQPTFGLGRPTSPSHFRDLCKMKTFSWE